MPALFGSHVMWVTFVVEEEKASDPSKVRFRGAETHMPPTDSVSYLIQACCF